METQLPDKAELEREQLRLNIERLKIENSKLAKPDQPEALWSKITKNIVAFGGVVTVFTAIYGIWDSYTKTLAERTRQGIAEQRAQFEDAVKRLEAPGTVSKLVGLSVLNAYLTPENKSFHHQILFTLASLAATEKDQQTQAALVNLISALPVERIAPDDWWNFQDALAAQSRSLVDKGDLYRHRQFDVSDIPVPDEERAARFVARLIALNVTKGAVPKYINYRRIYCAHCDFRDATFPVGADFTASILDSVNFAKATAEAAVFDNAELIGASFIEADLRKASFRNQSEAMVTGQPQPETRMPAPPTPYLQHLGSLLETQARITFSLPDFSCADLQGANFENLGLIPVPPMAQRTFAKGDEKKPGWYKTVPQLVKEMADKHSPQNFVVAVVRPAKFEKANLKEADLSKARYFAYVPKDDPDTQFGYGYFVGEYTVGYSHDLTTDAFTAPPHREEKKEEKETESQRSGMTDQERNRFQSQLRATFADVRGRAQASFSDNLRSFLEKNSGPAARPKSCVPRDGTASIKR